MCQASGPGFVFRYRNLLIIKKKKDEAQGKEKGKENKISN